MSSSEAEPVRIYGYAASINVRKVLWACEELGIAYLRADCAGAALSAKTPFGLVPVLEDGALTIRESNTIVRYLAASRGRVDLLPATPAERARVEQWMDWQGSDFNNTWRYAFQALVRQSPAHRDPHEIATSLARFTAAVGIVDREVGTFIAGDTFTVADLAIGLAVHRWYSVPGDKPAYEALRGYYERLCARPGFARYGRDGGP
jgi:glutathione S-transferase